MTEPTHRQAAFLRFIVSCVADRGFPPSNLELREEFGIQSSNAVSDHLRALRAKGLLTWLPGQPRTLALTESAKDWLRQHARAA